MDLYRQRATAYFHSPLDEVEAGALFRRIRNEICVDVTYTVDREAILSDGHAFVTVAIGGLFILNGKYVQQDVFRLPFRLFRNITIEDATRFDGLQFDCSFGGGGQTVRAARLELFDLIGDNCRKPLCGM